MEEERERRKNQEEEDANRAYAPTTDPKDPTGFYYFADAAAEAAVLSSPAVAQEKGKRKWRMPIHLRRKNDADELPTISGALRQQRQVMEHFYV
uniref:Uncharacterized protein n=1 Tax=Plectus sambesii TaxID=2011161 RepID=A0A914V4P6_9BILA